MENSSIGNFTRALKNSSTYMNNIEGNDLNGNYIYDPLFLYEPIRRDGNKIYFYADIDHYSQLVFMQLANDIVNDIKMRNCRNNTLQEYLEIHICSYGGYLAAGFALYDFISNLPVHTVGIVDGVAMSAATLILLACEERHMTYNSVVLLHQLSGGMIGTYQQMNDQKLNVDNAMNHLRRIYLDETEIGITDDMRKHLDKYVGDPNKLTEEYLKLIDKRLPVLNSLLNHDLELSFEECEKYGIIDKEQDIVELTEEDQLKIQNVMEKVTKNRLKQLNKEKLEGKKKPTKTK